jgi:hypothetical protein
VLNDEYLLDGSSVDFESDDYEDPTFDEDWQKQEASRLINLVKGKTMAFSNDSSGAAIKIAMPSLSKQPEEVKGKTKVSNNDSGGAASKTATPSASGKKLKQAMDKQSKQAVGKQPKQASGKQPKQVVGKQPKQEVSRLIGLVKGKTMASSNGSSGAASKTATPSSGKQP